MSTGVIVAIVIGVVVIIALVVVLAAVAKRRRTSKQLQEHYGPEYEREVERTGSRKDAESKLEERQERRSQLDIRPLDPQARDRYAESWRTTQARFVDDPENSVRESHRLVGEVMRERGYPVGDDFDRQAEDVSVDHPGVASNYRSANEISQRNDRGEASTEDLRQALVHYRSLFDELLDSGSGEQQHQHQQQTTR